MGDVLSFAAKGAELKPLAGEITRVEGPLEAFDGAPTTGLAFREGDDIVIHYRAYEGRPETRAVLFGPSNREVVQALCRRLARSPERLIASQGPKPEQTWIHDTAGVDLGARLALVQGVGWATINVLLKKPTPMPWPKATPAAPTPASAGEAELYPDYPTDPLSGDDE